MEENPRESEKTSEETKGKSSLRERFKMFGCTLELFYYKVVFFVSYGAFGCLMTFLPLYFKQLGLTAGQTGVLIGVRPLCQAVGAPLWGVLADKYKRRKAILLIGATAWLVKNMLILAVPSSHQDCVALAEGKSHFAQTDIKLDSRVNSIDLNSTFPTDLTQTGTPTPALDYLIQVDEAKLWKLFYILLGIVVVGEMFGSILHPLLDGCAVDYLGDERKSYGRLRTWGSVGMVVTNLLVGLVINHYTYEYCGEIRKRYSIAFYFFAAFMVITMIFLVLVKIVYSDGPKEVSLSAIKDLFDSRVKCSFWLAAIALGISDGFQGDFNSWFLDDLKATSFEVGLAASLHFVFSALCFFFANYMLERFGYFMTIAGGVALYAILFICFSFAQSPWVAIVYYVIIGGVFAVFWSACVAFVGSIASPLAIGAAAQGKQNLRQRNSN